MIQDHAGLSLSRQAYVQLRDRILTLELGPGELLDEGELMTSLGLGRTPIREALQRLCCEGLVVVRPRRGTYVAGVNLTDLQQIFELRQELEGFAAALAAEHANEMDRLALKQALVPLDETDRPLDSAGCIEIDRAFHRALASSTHNKFLENELGSLYNLQVRLWFMALDKVGSIRDMVEQHRVILHAIECRDGRAAKASMLKHVQEFQGRVKAAL